MQNGSISLEIPVAADRPKRSSLWRRLRSHIHMRPADDDQPQSWWIASTALPLVAAAAGPLANVMSIVALVMPWRSEIISFKEGPGGDAVQRGYPDPGWSLALNGVSVACGVVGNVFLLFNFTQSIRYIIALPASIILWFLATAILTGLTVAMNVYDPPVGAMRVYSQAYWSAVIAAILYFILSSILMVNMLGYFLGRYPQHFSLTDEQRTLILQMTAFVMWLLIGAAIFQRVLDISFADALYFCDVTVLTLGFGDVVATTPVGRGLVWPYAVFGVIMLGLIVGSIHQFAQEIHYDKVVRKHIESRRQATVERSVAFEELNDAQRDLSGRGKDIPVPPALARRASQTEMTYERHRHQPIRSTISALVSGHRRPKLLVMKEEKDRFDAMRKIQYETMRFRQWNDLIISIFAFGIVWTCGALVFWSLEEDLTYFASLYFCFVCLLTIGYGDITPKSNPARPFFVVWSLIAIPTMTMLISKMSDTVVASFKHATEKVANWVVLPQQGLYRSLFSRLPCIDKFLRRHEENKRVERGFRVGADAATEEAETGDELSSSHEPKQQGDRDSHSRRGGSPTQDRPRRTIEELAREPGPSSFELAQQLAFAIRRTTQDALEAKRKRYNYEEWVEFTRLIQFTDPRWRGSSDPHGIGGTLALEEDEFGVITWDWIGENSPLLARKSEPEWVLDRLCESLVRYVSTQEQNRSSQGGQEEDAGEEATLKKEKDLGILEEDET